MEEQMKYTFDVNGDYKAQFETYVNTLITSLRESDSGAISNRNVRAKEIKSLTDAYIEMIGELPDSDQLERLSDLLLYEELHDKDRMKVRNNEYPIMSERQLIRRRNEEISEKMYEEYGVDKRNHKVPTRRFRFKNEIRFVDTCARIRNNERRKKYREFTNIQPVIVYYIKDIKKKEF
ncbi:hypothetical protein [Bacillus thuringiensis]|uniref:hypothetical protein n=1 Tax=Bacillus thuringiensis TaxID=1428 RepID=UPI001D0AD964|nr:hypothetical protein [Bacillus thuringiensis]